MMETIRKESEKLHNKKLRERVDIQVSLLTAAVTLFASFSIFFICYFITYKDAIEVLEQRVNAIYERVVHELSPATFERISTPVDINSMAFMETRAFLTNLRETTDAQFIFTAKRADSGDLVYVVDGLSMTDENFRTPGDMVEEELQVRLAKALDGEIVLSNKIQRTSWGESYWAFYPVYRLGNVVGAICIAFEASEQYHTYQMLFSLTPFICIACCLIATWISFTVFRRISNPNYRDVYNTDVLTGLKNRNAFEVDVNNLDATQKYAGKAIVSIDLNSLKAINDSLGHQAGDRYIKIASELLTECGNENAVPYRTGGDEFTVIISNATPSELVEYEKRLRTRMEERRGEDGMEMSFSMGYALFDLQMDQNIMDTYKRADALMYRDKQEYKKRMRLQTT